MSNGQTRRVELELPAARDMMTTVRLAASGVMAGTRSTMDMIDDAKRAIEEACNCLMLNCGEDARLRIVFELRDNVMTAETSFIGQKAAKPMTDEEREVAICIIKALCEDADIDVTDGIIDRITLKVRGGDD